MPSGHRACHKAYALGTLGDHDASINIYTEAISLHPGIPHAWLQRGVRYLHVKDWEKALKDLNEAEKLNHSLRMSPENGEIIFFRGYLLLQTKRYHEAIRDFSKSIVIEPRFNTYYNRGNAKAALKNYAGAILDYKQAISINTTHESSYFNMGLSYNEIEDYRKAIDAFSKLIGIQNNHYRAYLHRGRSYFKLNEFRKALSDYTRALHLNPRDMTALRARGITYEKLNESENAKSDYEALLRIDPTSKWARRAIRRISQ